MQAVHVLVDLENNQPTLADVKRLVPGVTHAWLFHSRSQVKRLASFAPLGAEQTPVPISRPGKNALDFHLAFYVGYIAARNPGARLVIVAIDRGYRPMTEHATTLGFDVTQVPFKAKAAPVKKAVGKKAVAGKAPAGKPPAKKVAVTPVAKLPVAMAPIATMPIARMPIAKAASAKAASAKAASAKAASAKAPVAKVSVAERSGEKGPAAKTPVAPTPMARARARKAPAKQPLATKTAAKNMNAATQPVARKAKVPGAAPKVAGKAAPARKAAPTRSQAKPRPEPQLKQQPKQQPKAPAGQRAPGKPPAAEKVLANLRTMGEKRPKKLKQLRRYVSSMLGTGEADPAVGRLVDHLVAIGYVRASGEALAYASAAVGAGG